VYLAQQLNYRESENNCLGGELSVWLWEKDSVEYEIFKKYERALVASLPIQNSRIEEEESNFVFCILYFKLF
jgi:hypothetical protein